MPAPAACPNSVTVASWNLRDDPASWPARADGVAAHMAAIGADVWLLQEAPPYAIADLQRTGLRAAGADVGRNRVLSSLPIVDAGLWPLAGTDAAGNTFTAGWAEITVGSRRLLAVSAHLAWGGHYEDVRTHHIEQLTDRIDAVADNYDMVVLGADFNTTHEADCHRHLRGLRAAGTRQYWVPVWDDPAATVDPARNPAAAEAASRVGVDPAGLPARAIDHIYVRGWVHGRCGQPLSARLGATSEPWVSDHFAIVAELNTAGADVPPWT